MRLLLLLAPDQDVHLADRRTRAQQLLQKDFPHETGAARQQYRLVGERLRDPVRILVEVFHHRDRETGVSQRTNSFAMETILASDDFIAMRFWWG
jgi:hypothetical protein